MDNGSNDTMHATAESIYVAYYLELEASKEDNKWKDFDESVNAIITFKFFSSVWHLPPIIEEFGM